MNSRAQITLEAAVLIVIVAAALFAMHGYLKRAIQSNWKGNADNFYDSQYRLAESAGDIYASREKLSDLTFVNSGITAFSLDTNKQEKDDIGFLDVAGKTGDTQLEFAGLGAGASAVRIKGWGDCWDAGKKTWVACP